MLGLWLQDHILALVDVDTYGMYGKPDGICAHLWVLQDITDHTAFPAFATLNDQFPGIILSKESSRNSGVKELLSLPAYSGPGSSK